MWKGCFNNAGLHNWNAINLLPTNGDYTNTRFEDYVNQIVEYINTNAVDVNDVILVGASMGSTLALKVSSIIKPKAVVLICPTIPLEVKAKITSESEVSPYPTMVLWSEGTLQETIDSMPDSDLETCQYAASNWRNESGYK